MSQLISLDRIRRDVARSGPVYAGAQARSAGLAPYEHPSAVLDALMQPSRLTVLERSALIAAIVAEQQRAPHPLWQSLLLAAFEWMIVGLRAHRARGSERTGRRGDAEEMDQRVLLAFLEAVRSVRPGPYLVPELRWATSNALTGQARAARRHASNVLPFDEDSHPVPRIDGEAHAKAAAAEVVRVLAARESAEVVEAVLATHGADESLRDYVERTYAGRSAKERAAAYERLKLARQRAVDELRARLARGERAA